MWNGMKKKKVVWNKLQSEFSIHFEFGINFNLFSPGKTEWRICTNLSFVSKRFKYEHYDSLLTQTLIMRLTKHYAMWDLLISSRRLVLCPKQRPFTSLGSPFFGTKPYKAFWMTHLSHGYRSFFKLSSLFVNESDFRRILFTQHFQCNFMPFIYYVGVVITVPLSANCTFWGIRFPYQCSIPFIDAWQNCINTLHHKMVLLSFNQNRRTKTRTMPFARISFL